MSNFSYKKDLVRRDPIRSWWEDLDEHTYADFVECVNRCMDEITRDLEDNNKDRIADSEDRTTEEFKTNLRRKALFDTVEHDAQTGGHTDLVVRLGHYTWKAESKIFGGRHSYDETWLHDGFKALVEKYSKGTQYDSFGCLLVYVKKQNTRNVMNEWMTHLWLNSDHDLAFDRCHLNALAFISSHEHTSSGLTYTVRHVPVCLYDSTKLLKDH